MTLRPRFRAGFLASVFLVVVGLGDGRGVPEQELVGEKPPKSGISTSNRLTIGQWQASIDSPGGHLLFDLEILAGSEGLDATIHNGSESIHLARVVQTGDTISFHFDNPNSELRGCLSGQEFMRGTWRRPLQDGSSRTIPFQAMANGARRITGFITSPHDTLWAVSDIKGKWKARAPGSNRSSLGTFAFDTDDDGIEAAFLGPSSNITNLVSTFNGRHLFLSKFSGTQAYLVEANTLTKGLLEGKFWELTPAESTWVCHSFLLSH